MPLGLSSDRIQAPPSSRWRLRLEVFSFLSRSLSALAACGGTDYEKFAGRTLEILVVFFASMSRGDDSENGPVSGLRHSKSTQWARESGANHARVAFVCLRTTQSGVRSNPVGAARN